MTHTLDRVSSMDNIDNRMRVATNIHQGFFPKVLCVCSGGGLRSPTAAVVLSAPPFNFNTRAVGTEPEYAIISCDQLLCDWANEIVCMTADHVEQIRSRF